MAQTINQNDNSLNHTGHFWSELQTSRGGHHLKQHVASYDLEALSSAFEDSKRPNLVDLPQSIHSSANQVWSIHSGSNHPENIPPSSSNSNSVAQGSSCYTGGSQRSLAPFSGASHLQTSKKKKRGSGAACRPPQGASSSLKKKKRSFKINIEDLILKDSAFQQNNAKRQIERLKYRLGPQGQQQMAHVNSQTVLDLSISSSQLVKIQEQFDKTSSEEGCSFRNQISVLNTSKIAERKTMYLQASGEQKHLHQMAKLPAESVPQSVSQISEEPMGRQTDRNSVSLQIINGTVVTVGDRSSSNYASQQSQMLSIRGRKFKRKSDFQSESTLNQILEQRQRISVNGSSNGKVEITVSPGAANVLNRSSYLNRLQLQKRLQYDVQVNQFEGKPSLNYSVTSNQIVEPKESSECFDIQKSTKRTKQNQQISLNPSEEQDFDNVEDYIDEQEECGSEQKAIRFSIRCLDFQMMMPEANDKKPHVYHLPRFDQTLADQQEQLILQGQEGRQSLLSRASSLLIRTSLQKKFNLTSNQALPLQLQISLPMNTLLAQNPICTPQNQPTKKILPDSKNSLPATSSSQINMTNIDEKEEIISEQQQILMSPGESQHNLQGQDGSKVAVDGKPSRVTNGVHQCSNLSNYNMQTFFTPSQASKKNVNAHNFELLNASCNVFDKQKGQSAVAKRPQSNANKDEKINSPNESVLHEYTAKMMQARSKSQNMAQNNLPMRQQVQFQPAESKEKDTTVIIDEEEEHEEDLAQVAASADNKSKFNFNSIVKQEKEKAALIDGAYTGPTMSNSKSPWQTTAAMNKNKLNEKVKSFLAPKMQGTAEFCSNDKRGFSQTKYEYGLFEDQQQDEEEQMFQGSEDYKQLDTTPKVSQFFGRRSMTSNELLSSGYKFNAAGHDEGTRPRVLVKQAYGLNQSPTRQSKTSGQQSNGSPGKSEKSDKSFELKNLSNFRENRERQQDFNEKQRQHSEVQITPLPKQTVESPSPIGFQLTPIKQQLDNSQNAVSPLTNAKLPPRQSAFKSATTKKVSKSTRKLRKTAQKKTVNLSISDLEQMMKAESEANSGSTAQKDITDKENARSNSPLLIQDQSHIDQDKSEQQIYPNLLSNKQRKIPTATDFDQWSQGQRDLSKKRANGNASNLRSSDNTTGKDGPLERDEPLINRQMTSVVTQFEEIDALKMKKIDSEKEPKHKQNLLDDSMTGNTKEENILQQFVTKVPKYQSTMEDQSSLSANSKPISKSSQDLHHQHFIQTISQLKFIKQHIRMVPESEVEPHQIELPPPRDPENQKKLLIFDMDETLIHCVDDVEKQECDIILEIKFPDGDEDETVYAGINIRPYIIECLKEASKNYQVIVFTASHKVYADAILDFIDPDGALIQHRLYRHNCILTKPEPACSSSSHSVGSGFYVKDLRIFDSSIFSLKDIVIVDNSVYSFACHIDNGIPIVPFYDDKEDEEMLHLIYYLNCLAQVEDVREQNRQAFELRELAEASSTHDEEPRDFSSEQVYERIEECHQNQEETQSQEEEEDVIIAGGMPAATTANEDLNIQKNVHSFGPKDVQREYNPMGALAGNGNQQQHMHEGSDDGEEGMAANFDLKEERNEIEMEKAKELREGADHRSLKNIYLNLIDEDDIIVEEDSKEAISASKTNTASISEIQILKHHSNYSNNTGQEFKKLVKLIRNNSFSSQQVKDSQSCSQDKLDKFSLTAQSVCQKLNDCNTCSVKGKAARQGPNAYVLHHGGLSARGGDSQNEEAILTFRTRSNNDQLIASPQNIHQGSSFGSFVMQAASAQEDNWCNNTMMNAAADAYPKVITQTTPCRSKDLRVQPNSAAPVVKADKDAGSPSVREYKECREQWPLRADRKHLDVNVVQMSINLEEDNHKNRHQLDQFFKSQQEKGNELASTFENKRLQKAQKSEQMARRVKEVLANESVEDIEIQREARNPGDIQTPSSRVGSPLPLAQSQSRSNCMISPKSSIRSRRSRRNRVASRLNRDGSSQQEAMQQHTSSPSAGSQGNTIPNDDSVQDASQYNHMPIQNQSIKYQYSKQNHARRLAQTSIGFIATRIDQIKSNLTQNTESQIQSPALISFYGQQTHLSQNQSSPEYQMSPQPDL